MAKAKTEEEIIDYAKMEEASRFEKEVIGASHASANIMPMMSNDEFNVLCMNMDRNGFDISRPVRKQKKTGLILDGRNRMKAALLLNFLREKNNAADPANKRPLIVPTVQEINEGDDALLLESSFMDGMARRSLSSSQKAALCVKAEMMANAYARQGDIGKKVKGDIAVALATQTGTNHNYVYKCKALKKANKNALLQQIIDGELTVIEAYAKMMAETSGDADPDKAKDGEVADGQGNRVDASFREIFAQETLFADLTKAINTAKTVVKQLQATAAGVVVGHRGPEFREAFATLGRLVKDSKPYVVCPHCDGKGHEPRKKAELCKVCGGQTFLSITGYKAMMNDDSAPEGDDAQEGEEAKPRKTKPRKPKAEADVPVVDPEATEAQAQDAVPEVEPTPETEPDPA